MRQITRKGLMTVAAATGVFAAAGGHAHADSGASGSSSNSPGVLSGNTVQAPVHVPVNVCGNTVNVVGVLNPSAGNSCANHDGGNDSSGDTDGSGAHAGGHADGSPGVGSGNHVEAPIHVPVNVCGNSVDVIGVGNTAVGNDCANDGSGDGHTTPPGGGDGTTPPGTPENPGNPGNPGDPEEPGTPSTPPTPGGETPGDDGSTDVNRPGGQSVAQPRGTGALAETGSELPIGAAVSLGAGALLGGAVLYRRARASA
ncbi:chaplin [Streptomyces sp. HC307]|uniref:chaplin n=1 Tax=Streptomyces flavusporus TaxID=3385496 RepID=UPI003916E112